MTKSTPVFKLLIFVLVTMLTGFGVATLVGNLRFGSTHTYSAVFSSASGIGSGADVRVAGVPMGKVTDVALNSDSTAMRSRASSPRLVSWVAVVTMAWGWARQRAPGRRRRTRNRRRWRGR